ncbi:centromere protein C-like isoform X2 [Phragmites australis]|uniref:centromere protein C-like isoform X2 n=1 Tax=Phragmites australis TaxID=29695 RepID=UPI002D7787DC|nr:centromere protein C-like isoform X2 [Phragmites australis]
MDAAAPLLAVSSATRLLCRTLGPVPAASPSKVDEALPDAISGPLKGSKELVEQARMVMKEHGDIRMLYQDGGAKAMAAANCKNQPGRRPALDRKPSWFTIKPFASKPVPAVDRSVLQNISNPEEYFTTLDRLDEAEEEIKRLKGESATEKTYNFEPVDEPKRRRKTVHTFKFRAGPETLNPIEIPASQTETMTKSQLSQDDAHASVSEINEQPVPSRSIECAILDVSAKEDSFAEDDDGDALTYLLTSFRNLDESKEENFMRETFGLPEVRMDFSCPRDPTVPGNRPQRSNTVRKKPKRVRTSEPGEREARISELEKRISFIYATKDKCADLLEDDESEGSPDIVMGEQSLVLDSSDVVLMTDETFAAREIYKETPNPSIKSAEYDLDPEPKTANRVTIDERQVGGSPLGLYRDIQVDKEKDPCSRHNISFEFALQEDDVPMDYPTIDKPNNETEVSSHHLAGGSAEVLVSTPGRNVAPDNIARTSHAAEENNQHREVVEEYGAVQDKSCHPPEMPLDDNDPHNQSQVYDGNIKKLAADLQNALFPTKEKKQKAAQKGKKKQQPKRGENVADEASHPPETLQVNFDSENQPHMHDVNIETVGMRNALPPNKAKGQKEAQRRNTTQQLNRRKSLADAGLAWQSGVRRSTRIRSRPLEYWLGERFVYGRIHDTMATVIGIKAYSPSQDGKKALKVKSFVPEQYKDLVAESGKY